MKEVKIEEAKTVENKLIGLEQEKQAIELAVKMNFPVLSIGKTGAGKTYTIQHVAKLHGAKAIRLSLNGEVGVNELLGKWLVKSGSTYWQDGVLVEAMRNGWWIILDELNAALPEVLFCLNSLLDDSKSLILAEKDGEHVIPNENFRVFATMNPAEDYAGTKELNKALLSRFPIVIFFDNYPADIEMEIIKYQSGIEETTARIMVDVANSIRKLENSKEIYYTCSTRDVVNWARVMASDGMNLAESFQFSILNKANFDEREKIVNAAATACSIKVNWKWKKEDPRKLTEDLKVSLEVLEEKRKTLTSMVTDVENKLAEVKKEVRK